MSTSKTDGKFLSLTVTLGGRPYPLRVLPEDEEPIRRIAKELNDKLTDFQETYPGRDKQDCLSMLLLIYAVDLYKVKDGRAALDPKIGRSLNQLESTLKSALVPSR